MIIMAYNNYRKGYETKDGGLIRISGEDKVRIDIYNGNEREKGGHTRDTINYDTNSGTGTIDSHNEDKTDKSSTDVSCYLTTACMRHMMEKFDDNCEELTVLRWFRDNFVLEEDIEHYYKTAPVVVEAINNVENNAYIYNYIYENVISSCVNAIKNGDYEFAYSRYKNSILILEEQFARPALEQRLVKILKLNI
jgi:hypothetical protein